MRMQRQQLSPPSTHERRDEESTTSSAAAADDSSDTLVVERFRLQGFVSPLAVLTAEAASRCYQQFLEYERTVLSLPRQSSASPTTPTDNDRRIPESALSGDDRFKTHLLLPWAWDLVHHPALVNAVKECLGTQDLWCWSTDLNIKEPSSDSLYAWHQDAAYAKMDPSSDALTAWVAVTPSTVELGCLHCVAGSHLMGELPHAVGRGGTANVLAYRQEVEMGLNLPNIRDVNNDQGEGNATGRTFPLTSSELAAEPMELEAGQASLHSFLTVHSSPPNRSPSHRRVGLAIRYVSSRCRRKPGCTARERATLVSGDGRGLFEPESEPRVAMGDEERRAHAASLELERRNYLPEGQSYS
jgi:ectoine hydroxylase-related dioxygenase (phytanoyl-CoA dioxygenase family)